MSHEERKKKKKGKKKCWLSISKPSHATEVCVSFSSCFIHTFIRRGKENMHLIKIPSTFPEPMCFADGKTQKTD